MIVAVIEEKPVKLSRKKRLKLKKREKKNEAVESAFEFKTDHVKFGEVAHAPPTLRFKPKGLCDQEFDKVSSFSFLSLLFETDFCFAVL